MLNSFLHALLFCSSARSGAQRLVFCSRFTTGICLRCCPVFFLSAFVSGLGFAGAAAQCSFDPLFLFRTGICLRCCPVFLYVLTIFAGCDEIGTFMTDELILVAVVLVGGAGVTWVNCLGTIVILCGSGDIWEL